jgi:hypothetical protein
MRFLLIVRLPCLVTAAATGVIRSSRVIFRGSEKAGKVQRFVGHSSQEEQKMVTTVGQKNEQTDKYIEGLKQKIKL